MAEEPSPRELERRMDDMRDEMRSGFAQINSRFDKVPTSELLMAHPNAWQQQLDHVRGEQANPREYVGKEFAERDAQRQSDRRTVQWFVGVIALPTVLSLLAIAAATGVIG